MSALNSCNVLDLSLDNSLLYQNCDIQLVGGRKTLITPIQDATNIIGQNAISLISNFTDKSSIVLTGPMAVWSYLIVFHIVVHKFTKVFYDDGRSGSILIAQH